MRERDLAHTELRITPGRGGPGGVAAPRTGRGGAARGSGAPLYIPGRAEHLRARGVDLYRFRHGGHEVVVFERGGRTCVVSGHVKHRHTLDKLSSWQGDGRVTF